MGSVRCVLIGRHGEVKNIIKKKSKSPQSAKKSNSGILDDEEKFIEYGSFLPDDIIVLFRTEYKRMESSARRASEGNEVENKYSIFNWETYKLVHIGRFFVDQLKQGTTQIVTMLRNNVSDVDARLIISAYTTLNDKDYLGSFRTETLSSVQERQLDELMDFVSSEITQNNEEDSENSGIVQMSEEDMNRILSMPPMQPGNASLSELVNDMDSDELYHLLSEDRVLEHLINQTNEPATP
jgi:hypothetical protein